MFFIKDESGVTAMEYGLFAALWAIVVISIYANISINLSMVLDTVLTALSFT